MPAFSTATVIALAGLAVGAAGTGFSIIQQQKAAKEQKKAERERQNQENNRIRRERRAALREAQIKRAAISNFAGAEGTGDSSAPLAGSTSIGSQLGNAFGFGTMVSSSNAKIGMHNQKALNASTRGAIGGAIGQLGFKAANFGLGQGAFQGGGSGGSGFIQMQNPGSTTFYGTSPPMNSWQASFG